MFLVNIPTDVAKVKLVWQLITGLFTLIISLVVLLILDDQSFVIEQKIEYTTHLLTAVATIVGLGIISYNIHYTRMLVKEIQEKHSNDSNMSSTKLQLLEKLIENQDIKIEVSYTNSGDDKIPKDFYQAVEQLGSDIASSRLGAIYTLEQIAKDYPSKQWTIMETLAAFIRENVPYEQSDEDLDDESIEELVLLPTDIQAALTVIARRDVSKESANQKLDLRYVDITGADLSGANLQNADFTGSCLQGCLFMQANLQAVDFSEVDMQSSVLYEANLTEALFYEANLQAAVLPKANLSKAVFYQANLHLATLYDANLTEAIFYQAFLEGANLSDANLKLANLEGCNISHANLIGANLQGANLIGANLQNASLSTACLTEAILFEASLSKANLYNANLTHANLVGANLTGTILQDADLSGADLSRVQNLEQQQLELAQGNTTTTLPQHLTPPTTWAK
ncbi:pentapeptide repeat-containing protein [Calothrix sp. NIES-4071]|nr:pentapeptide repeat-containing protein [Calothrix sp. NIES-4071]BAZ58807.1 pentapeptide repeat-containing protein [Calothrix sp. NIES-4105]